MSLAASLVVCTIIRVLGAKSLARTTRSTTHYLLIEFWTRLVMFLLMRLALFAEFRELMLLLSVCESGEWWNFLWSRLKSLKWLYTLNKNASTAFIHLDDMQYLNSTDSVGTSPKYLVLDFQSSCLSKSGLSTKSATSPMSANTGCLLLSMNEVIWFQSHRACNC